MDRLPDFDNLVRIMACGSCNLFQRRNKQLPAIVYPVAPSKNSNGYLVQRKSFPEWHRYVIEGALTERSVQVPHPVVRRVRKLLTN